MSPLVPSHNKACGELLPAPDIISGLWASHIKPTSVSFLSPPATDGLLHPLWCHPATQPLPQEFPGLKPSIQFDVHVSHSPSVTFVIIWSSRTIFVSYFMYVNILPAFLLNCECAHDLVSLLSYHTFWISAACGCFFITLTLATIKKNVLSILL